MTSEVVTAEGAAAPVISIDRPYRSSWADAIVAALDRMPGPTWLAYIGLVGIGAALIVAEGVTHRLGLAALSPTYFTYLFFYIFPLAAYHYLATGARAAWDAFRPATALDETTAARLRLELSTTPFWPTAIIWIVTATANVASSVAYPEATDLADQPPAYFLLRVVSESLWVAPISFVLVYLVVRQLRLIARMHREVVRVDLLRPVPLHAMSKLTARASLALVVFGVFSGLPLPGVSETAWLATVAFFTAPFIVLSSIVFIAPLRGMSRLLVEEKTRLLDAIAARIHSTTRALHRVVDAETANLADIEGSRAAQTRIDGLNKALASLLQERDFVRRLPTWPWDGSTLRAVASAIALPIALFLITRLLERLIT